MEKIQANLQAFQDQKNQERKDEIGSILSSSEQNQVFYNEFKVFLIYIGIQDDFLIKDFNKIFAHVQVRNNIDIDRINRIQNILAHRLKKINSLNVNPEAKIQKFIQQIIGEKNVDIIQSYLQENNTVIQNIEYNDKEERYKFLHNAGNKLVVPVIAGGMGTMGLFNFLTKGGIQNIGEKDILQIPGMDNVVQGLITIAILYLIKYSLKKHIK